MDRDVFFAHMTKLRWQSAEGTPLRTIRWALLLAMLPLTGPAAPTSAWAQDASEPFSAAYVQKIAADAAKKPFMPPKGLVPERWASLGYDQYRDIRYRNERAIWRGEGRNFELQFLPVGWLYKDPVTIHIVDGNATRLVESDNSRFEFGKVVGPPGDSPPLSYSGFRITGPLNRPNAFDEIVVFQGASYFRGLSRGQVYGLSARGLAIDTAQPTGEEFPFFRSFWIETPPKGAKHIVLHALLDSPSATGAYTFRITGGAPTTMDIDVRLFPRRDIVHVGLAPLTSMFLFSGLDRARVSDFRRAVHDSDGLAIVSGAGEHIWRALANPRRLQISVFSVDELGGFGLIQRQRAFQEFEDLEATYERRPSAWVQPVGPWGQGSVHLIEIPSEEEIHDNIVAYWRPAAPYAKGEPYGFSYRLLWPTDVPLTWPGARVVNTFSGLANGSERKSGAIRYVVDFAGPALNKLRELPEAAISATAGRINTPVVQANPHTRGVRVDFLLTPQDADLVEMRLELKSQDKTISEVWLSRWTK
jgi:periplasmic glucans biosynthesis protein